MVLPEGPWAQPAPTTLQLGSISSTRICVRPGLDTAGRSEMSSQRRFLKETRGGHRRIGGDIPRRSYSPNQPRSLHTTLRRPPVLKVPLFIQTGQGRRNFIPMQAQQWLFCASPPKDAHSRTK